MFGNRLGVGWLMVLFSGMAGNLLNAYMYESAHVSIGASTAVFGAIGILTGYQGVKYKRTPEKMKTVWVPLACGLALLGLLGSGEGDVDIMAHLFGFFCGTLIGGIYGLYIKNQPAKIFQWISAASMVAIVFFSWSAG